MPATLTKKVLIIDDDQHIRGALHRRFSGQGIDVTESIDGDDGLKAMNREAFDCILLDLKMPHKDGTQVLAERSQTRNARTPVYVLTSMPADEASYRAKELGADDVLSKSTTSPSEVVEMVKHRVLGI